MTAIRFPNRGRKSCPTNQNVRSPKPQSPRTAAHLCQRRSGLHLAETPLRRVREPLKRLPPPGSLRRLRHRRRRLQRSTPSSSRQQQPREPRLKNRPRSKQQRSKQQRSKQPSKRHNKLRPPLKPPLRRPRKRPRSKKLRPRRPRVKLPYCELRLIRPQTPAQPPLRPLDHRPLDHRPLDHRRARGRRPPDHLPRGNRPPRDRVLLLLDPRERQELARRDRVRSPRVPVRLVARPREHPLARARHNAPPQVGRVVPPR